MRCKICRLGLAISAAPAVVAAAGLRLVQLAHTARAPAGAHRPPFTVVVPLKVLTFTVIIGSHRCVSIRPEKIVLQIITAQQTGLTRNYWQVEI
jgi:hypothetical protein